MAEALDLSDAPPRVFISYSHDTREHKDRVLALANRLRSDGVDAVLDQYESAPAEGWPRWMDRQISDARFVLLVCSETYLRRVMGREAPGVGHGVIWESNLIYQLIYEQASQQTKFLPVLLAGGAPKHIPGPLRGATYYELTRDDGYELLYRRLTAQPAVGRPPPVGCIRCLDQRPRQWEEQPAAPAAPPPATPPPTSDAAAPGGDGYPTESAVAPQPRGPVLNRRHAQHRAPESGIDLLNPINRAVPLIGRERELTQLDSWLADERSILARCMVGPPGSGKTRLALELCLRAEAAGWNAGFIEASELVRFTAPPLGDAAWWTGPTLIIVDQASSLGRSLRPLLAQLVAMSAQTRPPLRLLVLARHASPALGWWADLLAARDWSEEGILHLFDPPEPCPLASLLESEQRRALLAAAIDAAARVKGLRWPIRPPEPGADPGFDRDLARADGGLEPLHVLMAGINSVECGHATLQFNRAELVEKIAAHELGRLEAIAGVRNLDPPFLVHMAAFLTLVRGCPRSLLPRLIEGERTAMGWVARDSTPEIERALCDALSYDEQAEDIAPILPELIGEAALIQALGRYAADVQAAIIRRGYWIYAEDATGMVIRTAQDFPAAGGGLAMGWLDVLVAEADQPDELIALSAQLPDRTVALMGKAAAIQERMVESLADRYQLEGTAAARAELAHALVQLSTRRRDLGRFDDACAAAQQAVDLYRQLSASGDTTSRPDLAAALTSLAGRLSDLGRRREAFAAAEEAVDILRALTTPAEGEPAGEITPPVPPPPVPPALRRALAQALLEKALHLRALGRHREALAVAEDAVEYLFALDLEDPHPHRSRLAVALTQLAQHHVDTEHRRQALAAANESVQLLTGLVTANADACRPDLVRAQCTLARCLAACGVHDQALAAAQKAVDLQRCIALACPEAVSVDLPAALHALAQLLRASGAAERLADAISTESEAIALLRQVMPASPSTIKPQLARSLKHLAELLAAAGQSEDAVAAAREAVTLDEELVEMQPERFRPALARSQQSAAGVLFGAGEYAEAFRLGNEAAAIRRDLAAALPDAFTPELADNLRLLAEGHMLQDREAEATAFARDALRVYERLVPSLPRERLQAIVDTLAALARRAQSRGFRQLAGIVGAGLETVRRRAIAGGGIRPPEACLPPRASGAAAEVGAGTADEGAPLPPVTAAMASPEKRLADGAVATLTAHLASSALPAGIDAGCCQTLLRLLEARLGGEDQRAALADFRACPSDSDNQGHLRKKLRNAIKADATLRETLSMLLGTASRHPESH